MAGTAVGAINPLPSTLRSVALPAIGCFCPVYLHRFELRITGIDGQNIDLIFRKYGVNICPSLLSGIQTKPKATGTNIK